MKVLLSSVLLLPLLAQAAVYKCGEGASVVFTDRPCNYVAPPAKADPRPVPVTVSPADLVGRPVVSSRETPAVRLPPR
jgi:hypothetical protein